MTGKSRDYKWAIGTVVVMSFLGIAGGYFLGQGGWLNLSPSRQTPSLLVKAGSEGGATFYNQVVKAISETVEGEVKEVNGEQLVLQDKGDILSFKVPATSRINLIKLPPAPKPEEATKSGAEAPKPPISEEISLKDIKVGQRLSAMVSVTPEGLTAYSLTVLVEER